VTLSIDRIREIGKVKAVVLGQHFVGSRKVTLAHDVGRPATVKPLVLFVVRALIVPCVRSSFSSASCMRSRSPLGSCCRMPALRRGFRVRRHRRKKELRRAPEREVKCAG
jgi:hypothetical protein